MSNLALWVYAAEVNTRIGMLDTVDDLRVVRRYSEPGEIEMRIPVNTGLILAPGMLIWQEGTQEAYVIETTVLQETEDGEFLTASGRTCAAYLGRRALFEKKYYSGTGASIIKQMLDATFSSAARRFGKFSYAIDTSLGSRIEYEYETTALTLLDAIIAVCKATGVGFRCTFDKYTQDLLFTLYQGVDRTQGGQGQKRVSFDAELGNIQRMSYTESVVDVATVAYVLGETDAETDVRARAEYNPAAATGYARYEVALESGKTRTTENKDAEGNYIKLTDAQYNKLLLDYGREKLADRDVTRTTEGDILADSQLFVYGTDYNVGDIVVVSNPRWGVTDTSRIVELVESYSGGFREVSLTVGSKLPTLMEKMTRIGA